MFILQQLGPTQRVKSKQSVSLSGVQLLPALPPRPPPPAPALTEGSSAKFAASATSRTSVLALLLMLTSNGEPGLTNLSTILANLSWSVLHSSNSRAATKKWSDCVLYSPGRASERENGASEGVRYTRFGRDTLCP